MFTLLKCGRLSRRIGGITVTALPTHRKPNRTKSPLRISWSHFYMRAPGISSWKKSWHWRRPINSRKCFVDTLRFEVTNVMQLIRHYTLGVKNLLHYPDKALPHYDILCHCWPDLHLGTPACRVVRIRSYVWKQKCWKQWNKTETRGQIYSETDFFLGGWGLNTT
jgi:hypothetical protein